MAGMEQLQIHSRSYLLRWVEARSEHIISWSVQPQKKGFNFGICRHPGSKLAPTPKLGSSTFESDDPSSPLDPPMSEPDLRDSAQSAKSSTAIAKLKGLGYKMVHWHGYCEAGQVSTGVYEVPAGEGGMYALVFDNTFAKSHSKLANLALMTYPAAGGLPQSSHLSVRPTNERRNSAMYKPSVDIRPGTSSGITISQDSTIEANVYEGVLHKRRRKKGQGYANRYFSLDMDSSVLAYYHDQKSNSIRGIMPLSLAAIATNEKTREISIDSGAEIWHLRAASSKEFDGWKHAIESANKANGDSLSPTPRKSQPQSLARALTALQQPQGHDSVDRRQTESITRRVEQARNEARQIAKDTDPKYFSPHDSPSLSRTGSDLQTQDGASERSAQTPETDDGAQSSEKKSFWGRKSKSRPAGTTQRSTSAQSAVPSVKSLNAASQEDLRKPARVAAASFPPELDGVHQQCLALYRNLDSIVHDLQKLLDDAKSRKPAPAIPAIPPHLMEVASRLSMESSFSQEFFDAEMGAETPMLTIQHDEHEREPSILINGEHEGGTGSASETEEEDDHDLTNLSKDQAKALFPTKAKNLNISEQSAIVRRNTVDAPSVMPPSLIGFLRKNVGKDLSTISMPVSANEPLSLTQKGAEMLEYSELLDKASDPSVSKSMRLVYITAFAISSLAGLRVKERAIRKPFNPMLGETFEMIREDKGYRFVAEKVSHRPVVLACQTDSERWSLSQSAVPTQKFWGKSAELTTEGRIRVVIHSTGERFSWHAPTCFLRNIIAGEKYMEPVGTMSVTNETTGHRAEVTFKAKGMFSGRSEEVSASLADEYGDALPEGLDGKWTSSLALTENNQPTGKTVWTANDLPTGAAKAYGFTAFAASLNELSARDRPHVPPTDSRLRPDQRALEERDVNSAEELKAKLEEAQRKRRREMEERGEEWAPAWFAKVEGVEGEDVWRLKGGKDGYWEHRAKDDWKGVVPVLEL